MERGGETSHFVHFTKDDAHTLLLQGRRRRIRFDGSLYFLVFVEGAIHEVCEKVPNASVFLSGFNPAAPEALHPPRTRYARECYHPPEYTEAMSNRTSEVLGLLHLAPGKYWPSGKVTFQTVNVQALGTWYERMMPQFRRLSADGKKNIAWLLPTYGTIHRNKAEMEAAGMNAVPAEAYALPHGWLLDPIARYADKPELQWRRGLRTTFPKTVD